MKLKKILAGLAIACGFLGLAACSDSGNTNPPVVNPSTSQQGGTPTPSTEGDGLQLSFLTDGKARIDINTPGVTFKLNGTAVTSGQIADIGNFVITYEGTLSKDTFNVYWASVQQNGEYIQVNNGIETEEMSTYFNSIFNSYHTSKDKRIYLCITITKKGWTRGLDTRMDTQFDAMSSN